MVGKPMNWVNPLYTKYKNIPFKSTPKIKKYFFSLEIKYAYKRLEIIINGVRYSKKKVAPSKRIPIEVAVKEGNINTGILFLIPYVSTEKTISVFTILPTSNWGLPIKTGTSTASKYIE